MRATDPEVADGFLSARGVPASEVRGRVSQRSAAALAAALLVPLVGSALAPAAAAPAPQACTVQLLDGGANGNALGSSLAVSGNTLVAGEAQAADLGPGTGAAVVFVRTLTQWSQQARIVGPAANGAFGRSVAVAGDTLVVGAPLDDTSGLTDAGAAYVWVRSGTTWTQQAKLTASPPVANRRFGVAVAVQGNRILVGYHQDNAAGPPASGSVHAFTRSGTTWNMTQVLTASGAAANDLFGFDLALGPLTMGAGTALIGTGAGNAAYVFDSAGGPWTQTTALASSDLAPGDLFGQRVALSGDDALVAAPADDDVCPGDPMCDSGSAYVFHRTGGVWSEQAKLTSVDARALDRFGDAVALAGDTALVGAPDRMEKGQVAAGSAYWFVRSGTTWQQQSKIVPPDSAGGDEFGRSLETAGTQFLVGAPFDDTHLPDAGQVYVMKPSTLVTILFDSGGIGLEESGGTQITAVASQLSAPGRAALIATVQAMYDDALGMGTVLVEEGLGGCVNAVVTDSVSPTGAKYGNAGAERRSVIVFEGEFRLNSVYATEADLVNGMAETTAHEVAHKLGIQGHNCLSPATLMTAGQKVTAAERRLGARLFDAIESAKISLNGVLATAEPKPGANPNDLAILNGSFCVPPSDPPDDDYLSLEGTFVSSDDFAEYGFLSSLGEFVYQGDTNNAVTIMGSHFDGGFDLAVRSGGVVYSLSNGGACFGLTIPNPNNRAVYLRADVRFPAVNARLELVVQNAVNRNGGLLLPAAGGCGTVAFCTAKTNLVCGEPTISASGTPSVSSTSGFVVSAGPARSCRSGILLYSNQPPVVGVPFQGGTLCLDPMGLRRAGSTNSMGTPGPSSCDGQFSVDMTAFAASAWTVPACDGSPSGIPANNPAGYLTVPGTPVSVQFWGRDSQGTGSFVSSALQYVPGP